MEGFTAVKKERNAKECEKEQLGPAGRVFKPHHHVPAATGVIPNKFHLAITADIFIHGYEDLTHVNGGWEVSD